MTRRFASVKLAQWERTPMQYLLIIYSDETISDPSAMQEIAAAHMRLGAELLEAGARRGWTTRGP